MACPDTVTTKNLSGKLRLNKALSNDIDDTLKLQGVGYIKRTAIANFTLTLEPTQFTDDDGVEHVNVKQTLSGGFKAPADSLVLNGQEVSKEDSLFGHLIAKSWRSKVEDLDIDFLKEGWSEDTLEDGLIAGIVKSDTAKSGRDWVINVVWGFVILEGVRRFARRFRFTTKERSEPIDVKLYYDYGGYLPSSHF
ncbi:uncharacterized protein F5891DRAFT_973710 [Suillus fuscotomentosus]|uniref:Uncharacterized protein n=1 Tax=Suillus fuscotomentosus TaxID=1912939 RepID=A0AAD4ELH0_9AGAM|nr:uncharacterized protein F5891DRAFT_973710 [Suillus fuscotomentosus]KAG1908251.1 hypothetical protein F5891DRAFT_973710 [Suillus fuscotomentosus]